MFLPYFFKVFFRAVSLVRGIELRRSSLYRCFLLFGKVRISKFLEFDSFGRKSIVFDKIGVFIGSKYGHK